MVLVDDILHICGTSNHLTTIGDKTLQLTDEGYSDMFYSATDKNGKVLTVKGFSGANSNIGNIYANHVGDIMITGSYKEPITIDGQVYQREGSIIDCFIYDLNPKGRRVSGNTSSVQSVSFKVSCNWKGGGTYYPGTIAKFEDGKYFIQYDDGDTEWTTASYIRRR